MNSYETLCSLCKIQNKELVARELNITLSHLNNLLSGRKKISKVIEMKLASNEALKTEEELVVFEVEKNSSMEKLLDILCEYDEQQIEEVITMLQMKRHW